MKTNRFADFKKLGYFKWQQTPKETTFELYLTVFRRIR